MARVRSKRWLFTLNNYTEEEESVLQSLVSQGSATYLVYGRERGAQGTPHLQGYIETKTKCGLRSMKRLIPRAHLEKANGSSQENRVYCTKEDENPFEDGSPMVQGQRSDLEEIRTQLDSGVTMTEIAEKHFSKWVVYRRSFQAYAALKQPKRNWVTQVHVLWGITGTGKTRFAHSECPDDQLWTPGDFNWFDGYEGQDYVIVDDYRGEYPIQMFLKLFDRYPMQVPIKGGFTNWKPRTVYITSNTSPDDWYPLVDTPSIDAFKRRLTTVRHVTENLF